MPQGQEKTPWPQIAAILVLARLCGPSSELHIAENWYRQAEAAFRIQKSDLRIRPIWHQREDRVRAHILVCFLAYAMWKTLSAWQKCAGLGSSPRTILEEMAQIQTVDVVLPLETGQEMRIRCVVKPDKEAQVLLDRLGIRLPNRLKAPEHCPET